jgi:glycine dehydrogenase subunit 1
MEVANASMYDGASSTAEAVMMALRIRKRKRFLVAEAVHPDYRTVIETYCQHAGAEREIIPFGSDGVTNQEIVREKIKDDVACCVIQSPNFFGCIEDIASFHRIVERYGVLLIVVITEPLSLAILKPPGEMGADIVVGELQGFGIPLNYGGPYAGFFATRRVHVRHMPGRIVGQTVDQRGQRGFVLTLSTREQHIRREKATSNICTNHNLCALASTIYLTLFGKAGLRELARRNLGKAEYAKTVLSKDSGCEIPFFSPTFNEFVLKLPEPASHVIVRLEKEYNILGGVGLDRFFSQLTHHVLISVTERRSKDEIDRFSEALGKVLGK